jgi:serine/threonine protein kinase
MAPSMPSGIISNTSVGFDDDSEADIQVDAEAKYAVGRIVNIESAGEHETPVTLEIVEQLKVRSGQRSQVILARLVSDFLPSAHNASMVPKGSKIVAKFFDINCGPSMWDCGLPGPELVCTHAKNVEKNAYHILSHLQGIQIPKFYGEYRLARGAIEQFDVPVLLLQFIPDPLLATYFPTKLSSAALAKLEVQASQILNEIHAAGVCHGDIEAWNFFWNSEKEKLTLFDFEQATIINEDTILVEDHKRDDMLMLQSILADFGVKDEGSVDGIRSVNS